MVTVSKSLRANLQLRTTARAAARAQYEPVRRIQFSARHGVFGAEYRCEIGAARAESESVAGYSRKRTRKRLDPRRDRYRRGQQQGLKPRAGPDQSGPEGTVLQAAAGGWNDVRDQSAKRTRSRARAFAAAAGGTPAPESGGALSPVLRVVLTQGRREEVPDSTGGLHCV